MVATVVYTKIDSLSELPSAKWWAGDNESYERTKRMTGFDSRSPEIYLIGRQADDESVQLCYAATRASGWQTVGGWHVQLAQYFFDKFKAAPNSDILKPFFFDIDDEKSAYAVRQLICADIGVNTKYERDGESHCAILRLMAALDALGLPTGDWVFEPIRNTVFPEYRQ